MIHLANITKYAALITNDKGEVLFAHKRGKDIWINIGGRVERGESPIECLQRELREEIQCEIVTNPIPVEFLRTPPTPALDDSDKTVQIIWYKVKIIGELIPDNEIVEIKWVDITNIDIELSPQIREYLLPKLLLS